MKILWLRPSTGDNVSVRRQRIAEKLAERGVEAELCDASGTDLPNAIKTAITGDYDILVGNVRIGLYAGFPLAILLGKPFIGDVSDPISDIDSLPKPLFELLERYEWRALANADAAVFVHDVSYREAMDRGIDGTKLPNAVDYDLFANPDASVVDEAEAVLAEHHVDTDRPIGIYIGSFPDDYHLPEILEAAESATDWQFVFVGTGKHERLIREAARVQENVYYPGVFDYRLIPGFLAHATAGFCLTDAEQPLKLKEYGAAGLATIVPDGMLHNWYSSDELVFVDPEPPKIADTLQQIAANPVQYEERGKTLQQTVKEYSWDSIADGYYELFESVLDR